MSRASKTKHQTLFPRFLVVCNFRFAYRVRNLYIFLRCAFLCDFRVRLGLQHGYNSRQKRQNLCYFLSTKNWLKSIFGCCYVFLHVKSHTHTHITNCSREYRKKNVHGEQIETKEKERKIHSFVVYYNRFAMNVRNTLVYTTARLHKLRDFKLYDLVLGIWFHSHFPQ